MNLYVTGASGFVGGHVVDEALRRQLAVTAVVRPASSAAIVADRAASVTEARVDLRSRDGLVESLVGVDAVIHLAAAKAGDFYTQFAGTVVATENLLAAMTEAGVTRLIAISTFSVYDYQAMDSGGVLDENSPIDDNPKLRDEYAQTKLLQERLYRRFAARPGNDVVILRPGMIYGENNLWHALLGAEFGPRFLRIGARATLPLTYVENCAEAIVSAAELIMTDPDRLRNQTVNIVDDDLPTQEEYAALVSARIETPKSLFVPWPAMNAAASALQQGNRRLLGGRAKFPGIAVPDRLQARFKPFTYPNDKAKRLLNWSPRVGTVEAVERSAEREAQQRAATTTVAG